MLLLNNQLLPTATLPLPNRGLAFGDGFFETLVYADGHLRYAAHHAARLQQAAAALYLTLPAELATASALEATLAGLAVASELPRARLRLQLWRTGGGRYTPTTDNAEWLATAEEFVPNDSPIRQADFAQATQTLYSPLSFCKGPQAWLYVRAAQERQQRGLEEIILCDAAGHVAEAGAAAVFWVRNGQLFTPAVTTGCVAGVRRAHLLAVARQHALPCTEGLFTRQDVEAAEAVFVANVAAIRSVVNVGSTAFRPAHALLAQLRRWEQVEERN
ncbi:aminotransferase class IV [Hymenobacter chitinivorans]|uniref:branched-chain-amino-acid transaminase n=1 Tax=Hymenobacter chitinivorans DSM 11115 TaxID=1121954 RepID=A0A2M9BRI2_9BACT|nr:aminotransferase class IV [Hymenobacter chitinivorans]PJJ60538.1 branched-chain amino acid aminotransferase [Hymenobacter chitinivorans DSM 11115]